MRSNEQIKREATILWELSHYRTEPSCASYNYAMRRTAEMFFAIWNIDKSFAMFDKCCELNALDVEQAVIVRGCMERHGMKDG